MNVVSLQPIRGREHERRYLRGLGADLTAAPGLVLAGEPGIGRSALLATAELEAAWPGVRVLPAIVVPGHRNAPLSVLRDVLTLLGAPHPPRTESLGDMVAEAFAAAAAREPTVLVLDNAQHVDDLSWDALTHAARLLHAEPFALVAALPEGDARTRLSGLPSLVLGPLDEEAGAAVLHDVGAELPTFVRDRILEASAGNPLALRELAAASAGQWRVRCVRAPSALPLTPRLVQAFATPVQELPIVSQEVLLAAAANDSESLSEAVSVAAATLSITTEEALTACLPAFERRLVDADGTTLRFRSEAARSAVYQAASLPRRYAIHTAFAALLKDTAPHRAAWHRAAASLAPDEELASELEAAGNAMRARGQLRTALAAMDRAVRVSQNPAARVDRALAAAEMAFEIGRPDFVNRFVEQASGLAETVPQRRRVTWMRGLYDLWRPDTGQGVRELMERAEQAAAADDRAVVRTVTTRMVEKLHTIPLDRMPTAEVLAFAQRIGGPQAHPALVDPLAVVAPVEQGPGLLRMIRASSTDADGDPRLARAMAEGAMALGDPAVALGMFSASIERLRLEGRLGILPFALLDRARALAAGASLQLAQQDAEEAARLARESDQTVLFGRVRAVQALIAGLRGQAEAARAWAEEAERAAQDRPALLVDVQVARGLTALAAGEYEEAYRSLVRLWDEGAPGLATSRRWMTVGDLAEAAALSGCRDEVRAHIDLLAVTAAAVPSPLLRAGVDYAGAVLADDDAAEEAFLRARESASASGPLLSARVHLAFGTWLRRRRRITQARMELHSALTLFETLGAPTWSERARNELRAAGAPIAVAPEGALDELTPQERQIAELAASGLSNREIGQRLFLSHRTISTHLYRIFPKLGVTTRAQLRDALTQAGGAADAADAG